MAVFNEIDEGGLNAILTRRLGMPGGSPAPSLAPEIMPQMVLENDRPEWGWLKGEMRCAGSFFSAALIGNRSMVQLYNPPSSQSIVTIDYIENITGNDIEVHRAAVSQLIGGGSTLYAGVCDLRFRFRTMQLQTTSHQAGMVATQGTFAYLNSTLHPFEGDIIMPPNSLVFVTAASDNQAIEFNIRWYERVAQSGELV